VGSKQNPTFTERRAPRKSFSVNASAPHGQQSAQSTEGAPAHNPDMTDVGDISAGYEEQLGQQQAQYDNLKAEFRDLRKENRRLREQCGELNDERSEIQDKCNKVQDEHEDLKDMYGKISREHKELESRFVNVDSRFTYLIEQLVIPYAAAKGLKWNDQTKNTVDVVMDPLVSDALEAGNLREQVQVLQKEMFARIEKGEAISDEQLAQDFRNLVGLVKTLSRTIRLTEQVDVIKILQNPVLIHGVAGRHWDGSAAKKCMIEAWVWSVLLHFVFDTPFSILGTEASEVKKVWTSIFGADHADQWPTPSSLCETWRCTTMDHVFAKMIAREVVTQGKTHEKPTVLEESVLNLSEYILIVIETTLAKISPATDFKQVRVIVDKAFALGMQMCIQRSRLQVTYPNVGAKFEKGSMVFRPDPDGNDVEVGTVAFVIHPGLTKWGDTHGKKLEHRYDIVPSLVQLEPIPDQETYLSSIMVGSTLANDSRALESGHGL
jgi:hypothetical protein